MDDVEVIFLRSLSELFIINLKSGQVRKVFHDQSICYKGYSFHELLHSRYNFTFGSISFLDILMCGISIYESGILHYFVWPGKSLGMHVLCIEFCC